MLQALKDNADIFDTSLTHQEAVFNKRLEESELLLRQTANEIKTSIQTESHKAKKFYNDQVECAVSSIIASLTFPGMNDRYGQVLDAHANTYSWIFESKTTSDQPWDSFTSWLEQEHDAPIYWVSGKAASGKSTLMRYILEDRRRLRKSLDTWTQGRPLMIPKFFFWSTGTAMQKSQNGLFRSLLHQIFSQDPNLVQEVLPDLVRSTLSFACLHSSRLEQCGSWRVWSLNELKQTFCNLIKQNKIPTCYCFLIDGLDEYDGDNLELSKFFKGFSSCSNVKICLSSRPLLAFEHHFDRFPKLRLQDLTVGDITRFVRDKLEEHPKFYALAQQQPLESSSLISEIVQTSCGVFLWVSLVVKSLSEGLTNHDGLSDLQKRLRELPPELEGLYSTMLNSISPPFYLEQASRLFQLVYQSPSRMSPAALSFADDEDQDLVFKTETGSITKSEIRRREEAMIPRIKSRCAGLLEVSGFESGLIRFPSSYVQYLHLTVREYLEKPDVWATLLKLTSSSGFNASVSLFRSKLLMLKVTEISRSRNYIEESPISSIGYLALQVENSTGKAQTALLEALYLTVGKLLDINSPGAQMLCYELHDGSKCSRFPDSLLAFAFRNGLTLFVRDAIRQSKSLKETHGNRSLLDYTTWYPMNYRAGCTFLPSMVAMLFGEGLRPNEQSCGSTPWRALLKYFATESRMLPVSLVDVCKLFVLFGADVKAGCEVSGKWRSTWEILKSAFQHLPGESLQELERLVLDRGGGRNSTGHCQPRNNHYQNRYQNRGHGSQRDPNQHPQHVHSEDRTMAYDRFGTTQASGNRTEPYAPRNANRSNRYRDHRHLPRQDNSRRPFAPYTESSIPSMPSHPRRWRPY